MATEHTFLVPYILDFTMSVSVITPERYVAHSVLTSADLQRPNYPRHLEQAHEHIL